MTTLLRILRGSGGENGSLWKGWGKGGRGGRWRERVVCSVTARQGESPPVGRRVLVVVVVASRE